jgi:hypothetical protein
MKFTPKATAKQTSIMAMTAALYAVFFIISKIVPGLPNFAVLYLPVILLGVFPIWFGWSGLVGSMIGAYIGGVYAESLPLNVALAEPVTTFIIYVASWFLITKVAAECKTTKGVLLLFGVYAPTLLAGTAYVLWQLSYFGIPIGVFEVTLAATYALNLPFMLILGPILIRRISPKLQNWGMYSGTFWEWRSRRAKI